MAVKKYLDHEGVKYLWSKINDKTDSLIYERVNIELSNNQGGGVTTTVTVTVDGSSTNYSYNNSPISIKIKGGKQYTIAFGNIANYKTPDSSTYTAIAGNVRDLKISYNATLLTINVTGLASSDASKGTVTVKYGSTTVTKTNGQTILIPYDQSVTCTPATVSNYKSPSSSTFTTSSATKTVTMNYQSVILTIKISGLPSTSGVTVTVSGAGMTTQTVSHNGTARVPYGTTINFSASTVEGYQTPSIASASYTSNKTITVTYEENKLECMILHTNGNAYTLSAWQSNNYNSSQAQGVLCPMTQSDGTFYPGYYLLVHNEVIGWDESRVWDDHPKAELEFIDGVESTNEITSWSSYNGYQNTDAIFNNSTLANRSGTIWNKLKTLETADYPSRANGGEWYIPSVLEMKHVILHNLDAIKEAQSVMGINSIETALEYPDNFGSFWTSTQYNIKDRAWVIQESSSGYGGPDFKNVSDSYTDPSYMALAVHRVQLT